MAKRGSLGLGVVAGFLLMAIIGWIPIIGALIAGIIAGAIARGAGRGLIAGFLSGVIGLIILALVFSLFGVAIGGVLGAIISGAIGIGISTILLVIEIGGIILVTIGGLIGGALRSREIESSNIPKESEETEQEEKYGEENEALAILKTRYAKGEITKIQYVKMKKDLE